MPIFGTAICGRAVLASPAYVDPRGRWSYGPACLRSGGRARPGAARFGMRAESVVLCAFLDTIDWPSPALWPIKAGVSFPISGGGQYADDADDIAYVGEQQGAGVGRI